MNRKIFYKPSALEQRHCYFRKENYLFDYRNQITMNNNFELKLLATNWGFNGTLDEYCAKVKKDGYDGIEIWWPTEPKTRMKCLMH